MKKSLVLLLLLSFIPCFAQDKGSMELEKILYDTNFNPQFVVRIENHTGKTITSVEVTAIYGNTNYRPTILVSEVIVQKTIPDNSVGRINCTIPKSAVDRNKSSVSLDRVYISRIRYNDGTIERYWYYLYDLNSR